jgi:Na+/melibiose symporter-like transporter
MAAHSARINGGPVKLSLGYKIVWGVAALGNALIAGIYGAMLPIFYQDYLGLAARWIAIASIVYAIWNAINDPLFGYITDNTRSRHGRRIPYMRFTAPFSGTDICPGLVCAGRSRADGDFLVDVRSYAAV